MVCFFWTDKRAVSIAFFWNLKLWLLLEIVCFSLFCMPTWCFYFEKIVFYNEITKNQILNDFDLIVTSNPDILINYNNKVIKYKTLYNYF